MKVKALKEILNKIETAENMKNMRRNPVLLLGATGSGKTTLLHVLDGTKIMAKIDNSDEAAIINNQISLFPDESTIAKIGKVAGGTNSVTSNVHLHTIGDITYCDVPGFFDTKGDLAEMGNTLLMNVIFGMGVKVLWVVSSEELGTIKGEVANNSLNYLLSLLNKKRSESEERKAMSIGIVVSKGKGGTITNALNLIQKINKHWLIKYLSEHENDNAFWFPTPKEEGVYKAPKDLVERITKFAKRPSELITNSMPLRPKTITGLLEIHKYFDIKDMFESIIIDSVQNKFNKCINNLDDLKKLQKAFETLWSSLATIVNVNQNMLLSNAQNSLVKQWKKKGNITNCEITLENIINELDKISYFKDICNVKKNGFSPGFEKGILWEKFVKCILKYSNISNIESNKEIQRLKDAGKNWKEHVNELIIINNKVDNKLKQLKRALRKDKIIKGTTFLGSLGCGTAGFATSGGTASAILSALGAGGGLILGIGISKTIDYTEKCFEWIMNLKNDSH